MLTMPEESYEQLKGVEVLLLNALRLDSHITHQNLAEALETTRRIGARETYFIHMGHQMGLHEEIDMRLPPHIHLAYDGLEIVF